MKRVRPAGTMFILGLDARSALLAVCVRRALLTACVLLFSAIHARAGEPSPKSSGAALGWAIGSTFVGWGIAAGGIAAENVGLFIVGEAVSAFGPSAGHFYAGEIGHGLATSMVRGGALFVADVLIVLAFEESWEGNTGAGLFLASLAVAGGLGLYDWIDAPRAARRANERNGFTLGLVPLLPERDGHPAVALALVRKF